MFLSRARVIHQILRSFWRHPRHSYRWLQQLPTAVRGLQYGQGWQVTANRDLSESELDNPLQAYVEAYTEGRGIWKWQHYFEIYHRHFSRFIGREVHVLEIGVFSGGSLKMWREYFGPGCHIYGVDIEKACQIYADECTKIFIGDQGDRAFWQRFRTQVPRVDILIDDGGHLTEQQIVTLEEMLPHLQPGGVYLCEDLLGAPLNEFNSYVSGLASQFSPFDFALLEDTSKGITWPATSWQAEIQGIHFYPFVTVIEKAARPAAQLSAPKRGTEWQPFM